MDAEGVRAERAVEPRDGGALCIFEFIYFARPDSTLRGVELHGARVRMGERLASEARLPAFSWYAPAWRAAVAGYRGELAAARRLGDEAHAQAARVRDDNADHSSTSQSVTTESTAHT